MLSTSYSRAKAVSPPWGQLAVFDQCRDQIEAVASQKWDCSQLQDGRIIVKPEDLLEAGLV
jgi:hypothetical protein